MHYQEVDLFGVYVSPFAPLMLIAWLLTLPLIRLSVRVGISRFAWHTSLFHFGLYAIVLCVLVLLVGTV